MEYGGVGVAGNGAGLLNGQTKKRDSISSVEGVEDVVVYRAGFRIRDRVAKFTWVMSRKFLGSR
jgi:hypothetical protein